MFTSENFKIYTDKNCFESTNALFKSSQPNEPNAEIIANAQILQF